MNFLLLAFKNLKRRKIRTLLTIMGLGIAVAVLVSLLGFNRGYEQALTRDVEKMGYQVLVTAKGCPYEAATMMLQGGGGLRYIGEDIFTQIAENPLVGKITPQLIEVVHDPDLLGGRLVIISPDLLLICFLGAIVMGVMTGIYPAFRASGKRPIEAISSGVG